MECCNWAKKWPRERTVALESGRSDRLPPAGPRTLAVASRMAPADRGRQEIKAAGVAGAQEDGHDTKPWPSCGEICRALGTTRQSLMAEVSRSNRGRLRH